MQKEIKCSKCSGAMSEGFILDHGDYEYKRQQTWIEGTPKASFWSGIKTSGANAFVIQAFRCAGCGYLELYATEKIDVGKSMWTM